MLMVNIASIITVSGVNDKDDVNTGGSTDWKVYWHSLF